MFVSRVEISFEYILYWDTMELDEFASTQNRHSHGVIVYAVEPPDKGYSCFVHYREVVLAGIDTEVVRTWDFPPPPPQKKKKKKKLAS